MNDIIEGFVILFIIGIIALLIIIEYIYEEYINAKGGDEELMTLTKEDIVILKNYLDHFVFTESEKDISKVYGKINLLVELGNLTDKFVLKRAELETSFAKLDEKENKENE